LYTKGTQTILDPFGAVYTWEFKETIMGLPREEVGKRIIAHYDLPISLQEYLDQIEEQIELLMSNCVMMPGKF
jgi:pseudouridine 5'-phosphatase